MTRGVGFALLSLLFAGVNDVVFKRYATKTTRSRGFYIAAIGAVWFLLQLAQIGWYGRSLSWNQESLAFGLLAGVFLTFSNLLLLESLGRIDLGLGSTIYRLNTIGVVILSFLLLGESLGPTKAMGIGIGVAAVLFLFERNGESKVSHTFLLFFGVAIVASLFRAAYGISTKAGLLEEADPNTMLLITSICWVAGGIVYASGREKWIRPVHVSPRKILYSVISGVLVYLISNTLMLAVEYGEASTVIPIANMSFIVALLLSMAFGMESLDRRKGWAVGLAATAIIVLSRAAQ